MNDLLIKALNRQAVPRTPVWIMRQAGRYLPEYRAVREKASFLEMVYTPELAAEVTVQPVDIIGVDAAIIFSDILVIPHAMGLEMDVFEGQGPVFEKPLRSVEAVEKLPIPQDSKLLQATCDAIRLTRTTLDNRVPVIGFAGAPWTLAAYMLEGRGSKTFQYAKSFLFNEPRAMHQLLDKLTRAVTSFLLQQIEAGASAVQIFDSWGGFLTEEQFRAFSLPYLTKIVDNLKDSGIPLILFARGANHSLQELAATGAHALGIDWQTSLAAVREKLGNQVALQGNLDPAALYAGPEILEVEVQKVINAYGNGHAHVFNLGHGITPQTPVENVKLLVETVRNYSPRFHAADEAILLQNGTPA